MSGKVVPFKGEKRPGRRRRTQRNPGSSGVGTGFARASTSTADLDHLACRLPGRQLHVDGARSASANPR